MITIVGGSGFVGSRLIEGLDLTNCMILDKNPSPFFNTQTTIGNIESKEQIVFAKNTNAVVLLAAEHRDDVSPTSLYYDVNVKGTQNVLDKMDEQGIKHLVFTSSVAVYGLNKTNPDENHPVDPFNHYGKSKWQAEQVIQRWYTKDPVGKSVTIIRSTVIFGERNRGNVYNLLKQICSRRFIMVGNGNNKKSMAYVGNIVAFIKDQLEKSKEGYYVFNYADQPDLTMNELIVLIENKMNIIIPKIKIPYALGLLAGYCFDFFSKISGNKLSISSVRVKKFCATTQFDSTKIKSNFDSPYSLEEGLTKTLEHEFINPNKNDIIFYSE